MIDTDTSYPTKHKDWNYVPREFTALKTPNFFLLAFFFFFYFMRDTHTEAETQAEREAGFMQGA